MLKQYLNNGFLIKKIFNEIEIKEFESSIINLCKMQLKKLNVKIKSINIQLIVKTLKNKNPSALQECLTMARNTASAHKLCANKNLNEISNSLLQNSKSNIISGPSIFVNFPKSSKGKYTWHSEQNWYPKRRNFLNVWCPIFENRDKKNSMALKMGSHKKDWFYFSEYQGYDGKKDQISNVQYEIPNTLIKNYKSVIPKVKKNEGLFFYGKIVHRSLDLKSKKILFTLVFRIYDYKKDLTLSSNWADIPYNRRSFGVPDINID